TLMSGKFAEGRTEGIAEGIAEGLTKGETLGLLKAAAGMKALGIEPPAISQATGLTLAHIAEL
ncbi:MAG: hypothetical protein WCP35_04525, partial [Verrucomicrobiota bacterium]